MSPVALVMSPKLFDQCVSIVYKLSLHQQTDLNLQILIEIIGESIFTRALVASVEHTIFGFNVTNNF